MKTWLANYNFPKFLAIVGVLFYLIPGLIFIAWGWGKFKCPNCGALAKNTPDMGVAASGSQAPTPELAAAENKETEAKKPRSLWWAIGIAVGLIFFPSLLLGPLLAALIAIWALLAFAASFQEKYAAVRTQRLRNLGIYFLASALVLANYSHRLSVAQDRGQLLVSALKAFRDANRRFPDQLDELVPQYIDRVPTAMFGRFYYFNNAEVGPTFFFLTLPPFGRRGYCFAERIGACMGAFEEQKDRWYDFD